MSELKASTCIERENIVNKKNKNAPPESSIELIKAIDLPVEFKKHMLLLDEIYNELGEDNAERDYFRENYIECLNYGAWGYPLITKPMIDDDIDRLGEMLLGPLYTCEEYECPEFNGEAMDPVLQLNLSISSQLSRQIGGIEFGSGLLQLWSYDITEEEGTIVRAIPQEFVSIERMTPYRQKNDCYSLSTREKDELAFQIVGYKDKKFMVNDPEDYWGDWELEEKAKEITSDNILTNKITKFVSGFNKLNKYSIENPCLFGAYHSIQNGSGGNTVLCLESGPPYNLNFGDIGNGQIFYEKNNKGKIKYHFEWSCT